MDQLQPIDLAYQRAGRVAIAQTLLAKCLMTASVRGRTIARLIVPSHTGAMPPGVVEHHVHDGVSCAQPKQIADDILTDLMHSRLNPLFSDRVCAAVVNDATIHLDLSMRVELGMAPDSRKAGAPD